MRYLKVTAQDRSAYGRADNLILHFFEEIDGAEDRLVHEAYALDNTADGKVDFQYGDVNNDGKENIKDEELINLFAEAFLQLSWFNNGDTWDRYVKIYVEDFAYDGSLDPVELHFHDSSRRPSGRSLVSTATVLDSLEGYMVDMVFGLDMDGDGDLDKVDKQLAWTLRSTFLRFNWR
ncbi:MULTISPECIES: hypothetical protein [unclassified Pseudomonas]|jgi:hypothetical protein|uniref:hypothetical protein n=1 Tax=unclassified Pseudomonas TaxID=196821 RepID=UPI000FA5B362|nr:MULTISPECIES: hypothetical protein [unclassified Pseudomonas]